MLLWRCPLAHSDSEDLDLLPLLGSTVHRHADGGYEPCTVLPGKAHQLRPRVAASHGRSPHQGPGGALCGVRGHVACFHLLGLSFVDLACPLVDLSVHSLQPVVVEVGLQGCAATAARCAEVLSGKAVCLF